MPELTPQSIGLMIVCALCGGFLFVGLLALVRSKKVKAIEESMEQRGARLITEGLEHLADKSAQVKQKEQAAKDSADADRVMALKDQMLRDAVASIQSKL